MWVGADYRPVSGKWKWRNAFVGFDGTLEFINFPNFLKIHQIQLQKIVIIMITYARLHKLGEWN